MPRNIKKVDKKPKAKVGAIFVLVITVIAIYMAYIIYGLIKEPTNIFMVEYGNIYMEEEVIRIYN